MSRLRIFVLLATVVALAGVLTACGGSDSSDEDPKSVIENATLEGVESGTLDLSVGIKSVGDGGGNLDLSLSGPFQSRGAEALPELGLDVSAQGEINGEAVDFQGGITLLSDRAFINFKGTEYEVDPTTFGIVKSGLEQAQAQGGSEAATDPTACQEALAAIDLTTVVDNLENEGSADVDGTSTTKVSGDLNPEGAADAVIALSDDPACGSQLEAASLPLDELEAAKGEFSSAVKEAHVDVYVGDDDIIRKVEAQITVDPKEQGGEKVELDLSLSLGAVNEKQTISAPPSAEPLEGLFRELGVNPLELLEAGSSGGLGGLLEGLSGDSGGGEAEPETGLEIDPEDVPDAEVRQEYLECLKDAATPRDLQDCASLLG